MPFSNILFATSACPRQLYIIGSGAQHFIILFYSSLQRAMHILFLAEEVIPQIVLCGFRRRFCGMHSRVIGADDLGMRCKVLVFDGMEKHAGFIGCY